MDSEILKTARISAGLTQAAAAAHLGVTQAYLSLMERGLRPVSDAVAHSVARQFSVAPTSLPFRGKRPRSYESALGALGYPGFGHLRGARYNPAELLLLALDMGDLPGRVLEALPWLLLAFPELDWPLLLREAKLRNRQNRLGYILQLSLELAQRENRASLARLLRKRLDQLERCRLAIEDTLCYQSMTPTERRWQREHRPSAAAHWNLLTHLQPEHLVHV